MHKNYGTGNKASNRVNLASVTWHVFVLFLFILRCGISIDSSSRRWQYQRRIKVIRAADVINGDRLDVSLTNELDDAVLVHVVFDADVDVSRAALGARRTECNVQ